MLKQLTGKARRAIEHPANWDNGVPPTSGFTAVIDASGQTVTLDIKAAIDALSLTAGTLTNTGRTLTLAVPGPRLSSGLEWFPVVQSGELDLAVDAQRGTPEPGAWAMLAAGLVLLLWRRRATGATRLQPYERASHL